MRQINLIPHTVKEVEDIQFHPFWKFYGIALFATVVGSVLFGYLIAFQAGSYRIQLSQIQAQAAGLAGGAEQFQSLVIEQSTLTEELEAFQEWIDQDAVGWFGKHSAVTEILYHIVQSMPDTIWISELTCNFAQHELVLKGESIHKNQVFEFAQIRLEQEPVFESVEIINITEEANTKKVLFSIKITVL